MDFPLILAAVASIALYHISSAYFHYRRLVRNIELAKSSGLPVVVTPWHVYNVLWLASYSLCIPLLRKLPAFCKGLWVE